MSKAEEIEKVARAMAEATDGGDLIDGRWCSDERRDLWRKRAEVARSVMTVEVEASFMEENRALSERILEMQFERINVVTYADEAEDAGEKLARTVWTTRHELLKAKRKAAIEPETHEWLVKRLDRAHSRFARWKEGWE
jgi:hypothetical protein